MDGASSSTMNEFTCTPWISSHRPSIPTLQYIYNYIRIYIFYDTLWDYCGAFETTKSIKSTWLGDLFTIVYHMIHFGFQTWCISFMQHNLYFKKIKNLTKQKISVPPPSFFIVMHYLSCNYWTMGIRRVHMPLGATCTPMNMAQLLWSNYVHGTTCTCLITILGY